MRKLDSAEEAVDRIPADLRLRRLPAAGVPAFVMLLAMIGCGGGNSSGVSTPPSNLSETGPITVTATSGGFSKSVSVMATVQVVRQEEFMMHKTIDPFEETKRGVL